MTIEFKQKQIEKKERVERHSYIGYFAPNGELIDYNTTFGGHGHDEWRNPVSYSFLSFVSFIVRNTASVLESHPESSFDDLRYPGIQDAVIRGAVLCYLGNDTDFDTFINDIDHAIQRLKKSTKGYAKFEYTLMLFFKNAYSDKKFFDAIGRKIYIQEYKIVTEYVRKAYSYNLLDSDMEYFRKEWILNELMHHFKDICVQYLGYDSLERFTTENKEIKIRGRDGKYNLDFLANPRVITSSYPNINERYYNYLLMDWRVDRLPRYVFNDKTKCFEVDEFISNYESEREEILAKEIQAVKKLVPIKDRYKYFK